MGTKNSKRPSTSLYPLPSVMVSCGSNEENYNIITIAWTGTICSTPPMCYISIRPERHSHQIISNTKEYVINLVTKELTKEMDWCGCNSGRDYKKFEKLGLSPGKAQMVSAPIITESPLNIECIVKDIIPLGSHDMFISEVVAVNMDDDYEQLDDLVSYSQGKYYQLGNAIGFYGYSGKG